MISIIVFPLLFLCWFSKFLWFLCVLWVLFNSTSNGYFLLVVSSTVYIVYGLHLTVFNLTFSLFINSVLKFWMRLFSREHVFFSFLKSSPMSRVLWPYTRTFTLNATKNLLRLFIWKIEPCSFVGPASLVY